MTATVRHSTVQHSTRRPAIRRHRAASAADACVRRRSGQLAGPRGTGGQPADPQPNYALRRLGASLCAVVVLVLAAHVAVGAAGALAGLDSRPAAASETAPAAGDGLVRTVHVAEPGDTLWSIADRYRGDVDRGRFVDRLIDLNGGTSIQIGQAVRLP